MLTDGPRDQPARLRSLSDAIDWSYDLLEPSEQAMLRHLAIFLGGWTVSAAAVVAGLATDDAFDLIASLADKSLVRNMPQIDERDPRFTMLETIREYGLQLVETRGEMADLRSAHAACFLAIAERAAPELDMADQGFWLDLLETEHNNIRQALDWYRDQGDADRGVRLASSMFRFWDTRDYLTEGRNRLEQMLSLPGGADRSPARARGLEALAELSLWQVDFAMASDRYTQARALFEALDDLSGLARSIKGQVLAAISVRDLERAGWLVEELGPIAQRANDPTAVADADAAAGTLFGVLHEFDKADACMLRVLACREEMGDRSDALNAACQLAEIATKRGDYGLAQQRWSDALIRTYEVGERWCSAFYLEGIAHLLVLTGRSQAACQLLGAATAWRDANNAPPMQLGGTELEPYILARDHLGAAEYEHYLGEGRPLRLEDAIEIAQTYSFASLSADESVAPGARILREMGLTAREGEIFILLCERLTDREIGDALFISPRTVSTHVNAILGKLTLGSRRDVPALATRLGISTGR